MSDASGTTFYRYDGFDRLSQIFNPEGSISYGYDLAGNLTGIFGPQRTLYYYDGLNRLGAVQWQVGNSQLVASYGYDAGGNLQSVTYPNGVVHNYSYDQKNRLTNLAVNNSSVAIASYAYTLDAAGHRTQVTELGGRTVQYGYDSLYRLTSETISGASSQNGAIGYVYDSVGNRTSMSSTVPAIPAGTFFYDANDRRASDLYDAEGNTVGSGGLNYVYDFENHLVQQGGASFVYDGDGNRVQKIVAGNVTHYFVDSVNPSGYPQVLGEETASNFAFTNYTWGLELVSRVDFSSGQPIYFVHDGHGSVRALTNSSGAVTDTYDYDAFGNLLHSTGTTANNYLFAGQQFDPNLNLYYNRARYLSTTTGRFWSTDSFEGDPESPVSLHKYLYAGSDPVNGLDPSGNDLDLASSLTAATRGVTIFGLSALQTAVAIQAVTGALLASGLSGIGAALQGKSPDQIEDATGNLLNITIGALTAIGGSVAVAYKLGAYALALISVGGGGWAAYNRYKQGHFAAAVYYGTLGALGGVLSAAVPYLRGQTQTPPTLVLKGPIPNVAPGNLTEQLVLAEAEANAEDVIIAPGQLGDAPRLEANYGSGQWAKAQWVHDNPDGTNYTVYYFINLTTGERVEFKFTNTP